VTYTGKPSDIKPSDIHTQLRAFGRVREEEGRQRLGVGQPSVQPPDHTRPLSSCARCGVLRDALRQLAEHGPHSVAQPNGGSK
jgi:hypothetical protein